MSWAQKKYDGRCKDRVVCSCWTPGVDKLQKLEALIGDHHHHVTYRTVDCGWVEGKEDLAPLVCGVRAQLPPKRQRTQAGFCHCVSLSFSGRVSPPCPRHPPENIEIFPLLIFIKSQIKYQIWFTATMHRFVGFTDHLSFNFPKVFMRALSCPVGQLTSSMRCFFHDPSQI